MSVYGAGPAGQIAEVPTLLIQGTVDTLFNLNDAWNNYVETKRRYPDLPVKLIAFCGGHVFCPTGYRAAASSSSPVAPGESASTFYDNERIVWFNHYLRGSESGDGMPDTIVYQDQTGSFHPLSTFPTPSVPGPARYAAARLSGTLVDHGGADRGGLGIRRAGHRRRDRARRSRTGEGAGPHRACSGRRSDSRDWACQRRRRRRWGRRSSSG
jgi:hypothetical protein